MCLCGVEEKEEKEKKKERKKKKKLTIPYVYSVVDSFTMDGSN